jgi:hypothetical protein
MNRTRVALFTIAIMAAAAAMPSSAFADDAPMWLKQAAAVRPADYGKDVPGVVVLHDQHVTLGDNAKLSSVENWAVKLLSREGKRLAIARAYYLASSSSIREFKAWIIRPDGTVKEYDKKLVLDLIADPDDVYNEGRMKIIDASDDVNPGYVFGYSVVTEEAPLFFHDQWMFQARLPVLVSRYSLTLPSGWTASNVTFNAPDIKPQVTGNTYSWEMRSLPFIPDEPMGPSPVHLAPRIVVNYGPDNKTQSVNKSFAAWSDVSRWASSLHDPEVIIDDNVAAKARELTANATTEFDKIRAIGTYVQGLQYISIDIGVGHGNGYRPRSSTLVLGRGYGDCKDKANLMRAMLRSLKIEAYPVAIFSGDPRFVREEWPSPSQFNHCIIAIRVSDATDAPTVIKHAVLGRLMIFDATDPYTPVGDLPDEQQGSLALIAAGADGGLVKMPTLPPDANKLEREAYVTVDAEGAITGKIMQKATGQAATYERARLRGLSANDYRTSLEGWLTSRISGSTLTKAVPTDRKTENRFDLDMEFSAGAYAQIMQNRLMMFKPAMVGRLDQFTPVDGKRITPMVIDASSYAETIKIKLPPGFVVDEIPDGGRFESDFGVYTSKYEMAGDVLHFTRSLVLKRALVPATDYDAVGKFFAGVRNSEASPVVLVRK